MMLPNLPPSGPGSPVPHPPQGAHPAPAGPAVPPALPDPTAEGLRILLSLDTAARIFGAGSPILAAAAGADGIAVSTTTIPADKAAFRALVLDWLLHTVGTGDQPRQRQFEAAAQAGKVTILTVDEIPPKFGWQPALNYVIWRGGAPEQSGTLTPPGFNQRLYDDLGRTQGQMTGQIGNHQFYAYWPAFSWAIADNRGNTRGGILRRLRRLQRTTDGREDEPGKSLIDTFLGWLGRK